MKRPKHADAIIIPERLLADVKALLLLVPVKLSRSVTVNSRLEGETLALFGIHMRIHFVLASNS